MTDRKGDGMLERVTDAVDRELGQQEMVLADPLSLRRMMARRAACAALMAMRVPDTEIAEAGMIAGGFTGYADVAWTAMIDAILAEGGSDANG